MKFEHIALSHFESKLVVIVCYLLVLCHELLGVTKIFTGFLIGWYRFPSFVFTAIYVDYVVQLESIYFKI